MTEIQAIKRTAQFMGMCLAYAELHGVEDSDILFSFMGSGASDTLSIKNVKAFMYEVRLLTKNQGE